MALITGILGALAIFLLVPATVVFVQTLAAALPFRSHKRVIEERPTLAVLVPAHNEARGIAETLIAITRELQRGDRLLVIADNCTDDTARIAAQHGAEVVQRKDAKRRGKGFALDFGIRHLAKHAPEVLLIIDADTTPAKGAIDTLARMAAAEQRPVQALYLMRAPEDANPAIRIAQFAWVVKNHVRPLGYHRLGLACQLMGTGMAFPWRVVEAQSLANGNLVEDLVLGLDVARAGHSARFCPDAQVTSSFPADPGVAQQRTRWEHGHLAAIVQRGAKLLCAGVISRDIHVLALALDLCVPPLALLSLFLAAILIMSLAFYAVSHIAWPAIIAAFASAMLASAVVISWWQFGRRTISIGSLLHVAVYAVQKIPMYMTFITRRQTDWIRSRRDGE